LQGLGSALNALKVRNGYMIRALTARFTPASFKRILCECCYIQVYWKSLN